MAADAATPCPWCGSLRGVVHVHGHGQCRACGTNVEPCCAGDSGDDAATSASDGAGADAAPQLFPSLFERLGGQEVTVTTDALLFALTQRLASALDEAKLVLEAAERVGVVEAVGSGLHRLRARPPRTVD